MLITAAVRRCRNFCLGQGFERSLRHRYADEKLPETCRWLSQEEAYCRWASGNGATCLWIHGQPGAGKTMLCSSVVDDLLQTEQGKEVVSFFVSAEAFTGTDTARYLLDSLICQLVRKGRQTAPRSKLLSIQKIINGLNPPVSADTFRQYLVLILDTVEARARLILALDGLQTDEWITNALVYEIMEANILRNQSSYIRCIVTSINTHSVISHHDQIVSIDMGCRAGVQRDISMFAKARLALYTQPMTEEGVLLETRARQLCMRANGSFLWVQMVTEIQNHNGELKKVLKDVDKLPSDLQGLYAVMLQTVPAWRTSMVQTIFSWLLVGIRPLKLGELLEALIIEPHWHRASISESYAMERLRLSDPKTDIAQMCGGLVRTFRSQVSIHFSTVLGSQMIFLLARPILQLVYLP